MEPDPEPVGVDWYWEIRKGGTRWRWWPKGWEYRLGEWGEWWEVWVAEEGGEWAPVSGRSDGLGRARRRDRWRWRSASRPWLVKAGPHWKHFETSSDTA